MISETCMNLTAAESHCQLGAGESIISCTLMNLVMAMLTASTSVEFCALLVSKSADGRRNGQIPPDS